MSDQTILHFNGGLDQWKLRSDSSEFLAYWRSLMPENTPCVVLSVEGFAVMGFVPNTLPTASPTKTTI